MPYLNKRTDGLLQNEYREDDDALQCIDEIEHRPNGHCRVACAGCPGHHLQHPGQAHDEAQETAHTESIDNDPILLASPSCFHVISTVSSLHNELTVQI